MNNSNVININILNSNRKTLDGLIAPASEEVKEDIALSHAAEPIKSVDDILKISEYLIQSKRYRDNMLFILGINFGLRISDLRLLRFSNLINDNFTYKDNFPVFEIKTRNTRKKKKNRYITINNAVMDSVTLYLQNTPDVKLDDYLFRSQSNNGANKNEPITIQAVDQMLKGIAKDLKLNIKMSTHTLRKTFCYHQMLMSNNDTRKLYLLQQMLNHSSILQTLDYIGITGEEIAEAYLNLNLGIRTCDSLIDSKIVELSDYAS